MMQSHLTTDTPLVDFEVVRLMTDLALLASWGGLHDEADQIFSAARRCYPNVGQLSTSHALVLHAARREDDAIRLLNETVQRFPDDPNAKAMLAFVLHDVGRPGWQSIAQSVVAGSTNVQAVWLARHTLGLDPAATSAPGHATRKVVLPKSQYR